MLIRGKNSCLIKSSDGEVFITDKSTRTSLDGVVPCFHSFRILSKGAWNGEWKNWSIFQVLFLVENLEYIKHWHRSIPDQVKLTWLGARSWGTCGLGLALIGEVTRPWGSGYNLFRVPEDQPIMSWWALPLTWPGFTRLPNGQSGTWGLWSGFD